MKRFTVPLAALALLLAGSPYFGNAAGRFDRKLSKDEQVLQVLNRLTFGSRPGDVEAVRKTGVEKWVDLQLHPERIAENSVLEAKLKPLDTLRMQTREMITAYPQQKPGKAAVAQAVPPAELRGVLTPQQVRTLRQGSPQERLALFQSLSQEQRDKVTAALGGRGGQLMANMPPEIRRKAMQARQPQQVIVSDLMEGKLLRAVYSERQLEEVLVDFWFNHFNVYMNKGADRFMLTSYERDAIRPHVLGHFKDLLLATARHPAMLFYLDNWQSMDPNAFENRPFGRVLRNAAPQLAKRARGLNENYGRELLELHTLGVDGGYTQQDVIAVARCFTGWTIRQPRQAGDFQFVPFMHDNGEKVVLGQKIPAGGGEQDGLKVIDILVHHPATAKFISRKLAQRFVADEPPQALVDRMAATFQKTDGDLRAVLQTLFSSTEFLSEGAFQAKMKSPLEMVLSAARALNADVDSAFALAQRIADLGEPLYRKEEPTGYPNTGEDWVNTAGLLGRMNFANALAGGQVPGTRVDLARFSNQDETAVIRALLNAPASPQTREALEKGLAGKQPNSALIAGLVLGSPEFQRR